jgi:hypothetical protein
MLSTISATGGNTGSTLFEDCAGVLDVGESGPKMLSRNSLTSEEVDEMLDCIAMFADSTTLVSPLGFSTSN